MRLPLLALLAAHLAACATTLPPPASSAPSRASVPVIADAGAEEGVSLLPLPRPEGGEWFGLYLLGRKAGWIFTETAEESWESLPAIRTESRLRLDLSVDGNKASRILIDRRWFERRPGGRLLGFEAIREGDGGDRHVMARCDAAWCELRIVHETGEERRRIPLPPETVESIETERRTAADGRSRRTAHLDLDELEVRWTHHDVRDRKDGLIRVASRTEGDTGEQLCAFDREGWLREIGFGDALRARREAPEEALRMGEVAEVLSLTRVPLPGPIPPNPGRLVLEAEGLPAELWLRDGRQRFEELGGGVVRIVIEAAGKSAAKIERESFLRPTPSIDWEAPEIRRLAGKLRRPSPAETVAAAVAFVFEGLEKSYGSSSDTASRVLARGRGDCTEHALLFAALARANGIPTRLVHGLVHADTGPEPALYWHEWAEVWLDGGWIAVDPTFGQIPADATHLRLGEGRNAGFVAAFGLRIRRAEVP